MSEGNVLPWADMPAEGEEARAPGLLVERPGGVSREDLIAAVDEELGRLREILGLLRGSTTQMFPAPGLPGARRVKEKRTLTPAGRMRISEAQKRRWEKQRS